MTRRPRMNLKVAEGLNLILSVGPAVLGAKDLWRWRLAERWLTANIAYFNVKTKARRAKAAGARARTEPTKGTT